MNEKLDGAYMGLKEGKSLLSFETGREFLIPEYDAFGRCRNVNEFIKLDKIGQGTYGTVYKARDEKSGEIVALKKLKLITDSEEKAADRQGLPLHALREISMLIRHSKHENIVNLREIVVSRNLEAIFLVMELCYNDFGKIVDSLSVPFPEGHVKLIMRQLLSGLSYLHKHFIVHRDVKQSNLLLSESGIVKLADFGLARNFCLPPEGSLTPGVVTLWYRAPEILLGAKAQTTAVDMWAAGCVFGELLRGKPLLYGKTESEQLCQIVDLLGTPSEAIWPGVTKLPFFQNFEFKAQPYNNLKTIFPSIADSGLRLLNFLFMYDPKKRGTAEECLLSSYFAEAPSPTIPSELFRFCVEKTKGRLPDRALDVMNIGLGGARAVIDTRMSNLSSFRH